MGYYRTLDPNPLRHINLQDMSRMLNHMHEEQVWGIRNSMGAACEAGTLSAEWYLTLDYVLTQWQRKQDAAKRHEIEHSLICDAASMFAQHAEEAQKLWQELCAVPVPNTGSWYDRMTKMGKAYRQLHPEDYDDNELE